MTNQTYLSLHDDLQEHHALYDEARLKQVVNYALSVMGNKLHDKKNPINFAYFDDAWDYWHKPKVLDIYITNPIEGKQLNLDARGKDYATNILSYPSDLPSDVLMLMDDIPLGELIICHDVVLREAYEQGKTFANHLDHLIVHGVLHLLGFDHEISDADADEMEGFEIEILQGLGIDNPYAHDE